MCPAPVDSKLELELKRIAVNVFVLLGCGGYARIDMRMDQDETVYVLEANPNPDISPGAGAFNAIRAMGWTDTQFVDNLIRGATRDI